MSEITFEELQEKRDKFLIIDVRNPEELREMGKIPGAYNVPLPEMEEAVKLPSEKLLAKYGFPSFRGDKEAVVSCQRGRRAKAASDILSKSGFEKHRWYSGSFSDWKEKGGKIEAVEGK